MRSQNVSLFIIHHLCAINFQMISHSGGVPDGVTLLSLFPDEELGIFVSGHGGQANVELVMMSEYLITMYVRIFVKMEAFDNMVSEFGEVERRTLDGTYSCCFIIKLLLRQSGRHERYNNVRHSMARTLHYSGVSPKALSLVFNVLCAL